jgi:nucleoside phosphorylase
MTLNNAQPPLYCADYHVAWICPVANLELLPARLMLDDEHRTPPYDTHYDENTYICGTINGHAVVIATCPPGQTGNVNAGRLTGSIFKTFPNIRMAVLVGIGGGIPRAITPDDPLDDVHLGDVVVGWPGDGKPACIYHDQGRLKVDDQLELVGTMQNPDWRLLNALSILESDYEMGKTTFASQLERLQKHKKHTTFANPGLEHDRLYRAAYHHVGGYGSKCAPCDPDELVQRPARTEDDRVQLVFHLGRIATGNTVIQDGEQRDRIRTRCDGALCVEMEAAGVDVNRQCLVIRGISDYADSHKSDMWRSHAAGNAAAFARELLCRVPSSPDLPLARNVVLDSPNHTEVVSNLDRLTKGISIPQKSESKDENIKKVPKSGKQWSREEDEKLLDVVKMMGEPKWKLVAQHFHRDNWACQQRHKKLMQHRDGP